MSLDFQRLFDARDRKHSKHRKHRSEQAYQVQLSPHIEKCILLLDKAYSPLLRFHWQAEVVSRARSNIVYIFRVDS